MPDSLGDLIWIDETRGTAATGVTETRIPTQTRTTAAVLRTESTGNFRRRVRELSVTAGTVHQNAYMGEWQVLTQERAALGGVSLLDALADLGFSWRDVARLLGVSVPAIQKWRKGGKLSPDNRRKLASLLAACDFISNHFYVEDIGQWFEMPITDSAPITPIDLWSDGSPVLVFEYATRHLTPDETLDKFDPSWRERYRTNIKVFRDDDGVLGLRIRELYIVDELEFPGSQDKPDWEGLYLYRGSEVVESRPIFTGDVFLSAEVQGIGAIETKDIIVIQHPCALRTNGVDLAVSLMVAEVTPGKLYAQSEWRGSYKLMPLPEMAGTESHHIATFTSIYLAIPDSLMAANRIACLSPTGVNLLLQRWVCHNSRVVVPAWKYDEVVSA